MRHPAEDVGIAAEVHEGTEFGVRGAQISEKAADRAAIVANQCQRFAKLQHAALIYGSGAGGPAETARLPPFTMGMACPTHPTDDPAHLWPCGVVGAALQRQPHI